MSAKIGNNLNMQKMESLGTENLPPNKPLELSGTDI